MSQEIYFIRDVVAGGFIGSVHMCANDAVAVRWFKSVLLREVQPQWFGDYDLYHIATVDEDTGEVLATEPRPLARGNSIEQELKRIINAQKEHADATS